MNIFLGMNILWIFFWGHPKIGLVLGVIFMYFRVFLKVNKQNRDIFLGCKNFKIFLGVLQISDIFFGWTVDAGSEPTYAEKTRVPPPPPLGGPVSHEIRLIWAWTNVYNL